MEDLDALLLALPAVVMFGFTIYMKNIHEGIPKERAVTSSWTYGVLAAGFFMLVYIVKFATINSPA